MNELEQLKFQLCNIQNDDATIFYTEFTFYGALDALFTYLRPSVENLTVDSENQRENMG